MTVAGSMTLGEHLIELRGRVVRSAVAVLAATLVVWNKYQFFFSVIRRPYDSVQGHDTTLMLTGVTSGFSLQLKVAVAVGIVIASPVWLFQMWRFVSPGLHRHERRWAYGFTAVAVPLFLAGTALAYHAMPRMLSVLFEFTPTGVANMTSVDMYITFFLQMVIFFGVGFLLPLVLSAMNFVGLLSGARIKASWRYIILGSFVFGAVATPNGDPFGMTVVALPMIALSCVAMGIALLNDKRRARKAAATGTDQWDDDTASEI
jgi:sec-independent protein translocase protein TatC